MKKSIFTVSIALSCIILQSPAYAYCSINNGQITCNDHNTDPSPKFDFNETVILPTIPDQVVDKINDNPSLKSGGQLLAYESTDYSSLSPSAGGKCAVKVRDLLTVCEEDAVQDEKITVIN